MSKFYTIGFIFFTFVNFFSIILLYFHYHNCMIIFSKSKSSPNFEKISQVKSIIVQTNNGSFVGFVQKYDNIKINTFLGIPYASPPVDRLRFKKPQAFQLNNQTIKTDKWPRPCLQPDNRLRFYNNFFSEDCLYLNIWSPNKISRVSSDSVKTKTNTLPVLVIIHTGAFLFGSASETTYNGLALAQMSNSVVVVFNYRLNFFGFYYEPNDEITPNVGMLDQVFALKWIKKNIHYFNGDPDKIILIGQSSAALAIGMHMNSPLSFGLFSKAIIMSGSPLQASVLSTPTRVQNFWNNYAKILNCSETSNKAGCLIKKVFQNRNSLLKMETVKILSEDKLFVNAPIVTEGEFQPKSQIELINSSENFTKSSYFSLLFGYTDDEGSWIASIDNKERFGPQIKPNITSSEAKESLKKFIKKIKFLKKINYEKLEKYYLGTLLDKQKNDIQYYPQILSRLVSEALGDYYINCPANIFAKKIHEKNGQVFQYHWNYKGDPKSSAFWNIFSKIWCGNWMGSCHSFEMFALFGQPFLETDTFNDEDRIVSKKFIDLITYFAHQNRLFWPEFRQNLKFFYVIDSSISQYKFGKNLKYNECSKIWYDYIV